MAYVIHIKHTLFLNLEKLRSTFQSNIISLRYFKPYSPNGHTLPRVETGRNLPRLQVHISRDVQVIHSLRMPATIIRQIEN